MDAPADGFASSFLYNINLSNCFTNGCKESAFLFVKAANNLVFSGCSFENLKKSAIDLTGTASLGNYVISGCETNAAGNDGLGSPIIKINGGLSLTATGNKLHGGVGCGAAIDLSGTIDCVTITGNTIRAATTDIANTATIANLVYSGNNSVNTAAATSLRGMLIGNQPNSNTLVLDWYQEGTFTPTMAFGGASVGVTYTGRNGQYTRIGNQVTFSIYINLSSKGSSTGIASITGLPFTIDSGFPGIASLRLNDSATIGTEMINASLASGTSAVLYGTVAGTSSQLTDAAINNASTIQISGTYKTT
jgi:hypothetical protein